MIWWMSWNKSNVRLLARRWARDHAGNALILEVFQYFQVGKVRFFRVNRRHR